MSEERILSEEKKLATENKKPQAGNGERITPGHFYVPDTDIYEDGNQLVLTMDLPGVDKNDLEINLEKSVLSVEGRVTLADYDGLDPVYTEYNVGHFARTFRLSNAIDQEGITAHIEDGVLTLYLKKKEASIPRRIEIS
uniref:HSP20 family protein n=2 Tax=unclassified Candidatus Kentrum TaxID=2643149 RepID=A0A451AIV4_9GAMM|nr:MAG: HSP20 family protein [Candidatus Kentron sp. LPFa]VFK31966.1 MAG: HSP20 family protein [Candidatus Kentron sp. LPFa]VFK65942.1 MAG: HSP20 family protein [Candidatus Kentron sp. UNK]VFK71616.1 MAG: HSP20 family protein [Candidatus Kentron sp. UNK]